MDKKGNISIASERTRAENSMLKSDMLKRASRYNNIIMKKETAAAELGFAENLAKLRIKKGISAREMSLSIGQGASYINNIENGRSLPSMAMFFEMCEYLQVSPHEFFEYTANGNKSVGGADAEMLKALKDLSAEDRQLILELLGRLK